MNTLSIVIVNWNTKTLLFNLLKSLLEHPPSGEFEVIVVDNASMDGSQEMVKLEFPSVMLLANTSNLGFAKAVNRGISESSGEYVLLLNTDLEVLEGAIDAQIEFMELNPDCAFCGGLLLNDHGIPKNTYGQFPSVRTLLAEVIPYRIKMTNRIGIDPAMDDSHILPVDLVSGADLMARRAAFERIGLLDERFFMYFEDADWCYRAKRLGWEVYYVPHVQFMHIGAGSAVSWSSLRKQYLDSLGLFLRKHYHGVNFMVCWLLWQLVRAKQGIWGIRMRVQQRLSLEGGARSASFSNED